MDYRNDPEREILTRQMLSADTLPEVRAAQAALRRWRACYPDDFNILDAGEQLSLIEDALLEEASPTYQRPVRSEWQQLENRVVDARTLPDIAAARRDLKQWVRQHPEEIQAEYLDALFILMEVVEEQMSESSTTASRERELAGQVA